MCWATRHELNCAIDHYCGRCLKNGTCNQRQHKFILIWNDCIGPDGKEVGVDFYCEEFAWESEDR